jgi:hypothetical protein
MTMTAVRSLWMTIVFGARYGPRPSLAVTDQDTLNRFDEQGRKQGYWKVIAPRPDKPNYADGQLIEEGRYDKGNDWAPGGATGLRAS